MLHSSIQRLKWSPGTKVVGMYDFEEENTEVIVWIILQKIDPYLREWWSYNAGWLLNICLFFLCKLERTKLIRHLHKGEPLWDCVSSVHYDF